jgi:hypothetical protein
VNPAIALQQDHDRVIEITRRLGVGRIAVFGSVAWGAARDGEVAEAAVVKECSKTAADGKTYQAKHYNLQAIIAVGFKVNNPRAVQFRRWAGRIVENRTIREEEVSTQLHQQHAESAKLDAPLETNHNAIGKR